MKRIRGKRQKRCYKKGRHKNRKRASVEPVVEKIVKEAGDRDELWKDEHLCRHHKNNAHKG